MGVRIPDRLDFSGRGKYLQPVMNETEMLRQELEHYAREKERVRRIIGMIGGSSTKNRDRLVNILFLVLVVALFAFDIVRPFTGLALHGIPPYISMEVALLLVSLKIIWMIHRQTKVDHFQFWILNSIEYQINAISKRLKDLEGQQTRRRLPTGRA
jgi:hypothetical protein